MYFNQLMFTFLGETWGQQNPILGGVGVSENASTVAIIGAGIAGASVASQLSRSSASSPLHVTLFERESKVGGRIQSSRPDINFGGTLEDGAAWFSTDDECLMDIVNNLRLEHEAKSRGWQRGIGHWNNGRTPQKSDARCDVDTSNWHRLTQIVWKYGQTAWNVRDLIKSARSGWRQFLLSDNTTEDLQSALTRAGFEGDLLNPASTYFNKTAAHNPFEHEVLQPCTQGRLFESHDGVTGLSALLAARELTTTAVVGGNALMVERTLNQSQTKQHLNSTVVSIGPGHHRRYKVTYVSKPELQEHHSEFDVVILAAPLSVSGIQLDFPDSESLQTLQTAYDERHVTYFTSTLPLSSNASMDLDVLVSPDYILTSSMRKVELIAVAPREVCIYLECDPGDELECDAFEWENLYRVVSRHHLTDADLINLVEYNNDDLEVFDHNSEKYGITWTHRHAWPNALPNLRNSDKSIPQSAEIAPDFFYTSGLEHIIGSMEMSCRMGRHVADKIRQRFDLSLNEQSAA